MEHPPKQGLKQKKQFCSAAKKLRFNGTSTKTRIETTIIFPTESQPQSSFNGTSTKTRIETTIIFPTESQPQSSFNGTSTKTRIETFTIN